ncbi:hypothetical protein FFK22_025345 [Mycobacterium sp. KBS0706]|uniref:hypothetical protein n=1 Tax=Mycobacterium sp. KBS0706 TaxID=2578109 RepID=UPI00110FED8B|nr:hypothetical protein [Mycobacterium sp. KBS0706]TSD85816.1 hypothetical protein FFK22_025345 [Mycobacterium sp. KBS0706]
MDPQGHDTGISPNADEWGGPPAPPTPTSSDTAAAGDRHKAGDTIRQAVHDVAGRQKQAGAEVMDATGRAIRSAADDLEQQSPAVADLIRSGAERVSSTAAALRERNVDELFESAGRFARERPAALFGVAVVAGLALSRFLKSSARP